MLPIVICNGELIRVFVGSKSLIILRIFHCFPILDASMEAQMLLVSQSMISNHTTSVGIYHDSTRYEMLIVASCGI